MHILNKLGMHMSHRHQNQPQYQQFYRMHIMTIEMKFELKMRVPRKFQKKLKSFFLG